MRIMVQLVATMRPVPGANMHVNPVTSMDAAFTQLAIGAIRLRVTKAAFRTAMALADALGF
jgi:hypothetical protein